MTGGGFKQVAHFLDQATRESTIAGLKLKDVLPTLVPDVLTAIKAVITDPESTPETRLRAVDLLLGVIDKANKHDLAMETRKSQIAGFRATQSANNLERKKAELLSQKTKMEMYRAQKRAKKILDRAEK